MLRNANAELIAAFEDLKAQYEKREGQEPYQQDNENEYGPDEFEQDRSEIEFYLNEMKEVKDRIVVNLISAKAQLIGLRLSDR